jgi:IclR family acetate operon transcriptional repressor
MMLQSSVRTVSILLAIADSPNGLRAKEITEKLRLSRHQVTYHLIHTMQGTGIIRKNESNRYVLGLAAVSIAEGFSRQLAPPEHLARRVRSIVATTGETAYASGWVDGEIVTVATARGESPIGLHRFRRDTAVMPMLGQRENCCCPKRPRRK